MSDVPQNSQGPRPVYPPTYLLGAAVLMLVLHFLAPVRQLISGPYRFLGLIPLAVGLVLAVAISGIFRRAGTTIRPFERSSALVVDGPYRVTRNPIYLGMVCGLIGIGVCAGSLTPFLVVPAFAFWIDRRFIRAEETMLEQAFGSQYAAYKAQVRRWI